MSNLKIGDEVYVKDFLANGTRQDLVGVFRGVSNAQKTKGKYKIVLLGVLFHLDPSRLISLEEYKERQKNERFRIS